VSAADWAGVTAVLAGLLLALPLIRRVAVRFGTPPEVARKLVHVVMGLACMAFPWVFAGPLAVWVLAALSTSALLLLRSVPSLRTGMASALHGVDRLSWGEILFAPAVAAVFHLADGDPILHVIPIAILTLADAAGALAGTRWGRRLYVCGTTRKSVEGCAAFLVIAFICTFVPLYATERVEPVEALLIGLTLAILAMMAEGMSDRGFDNLVIPLGCYFLLARMLELEAAMLLTRFVAVVLLLAVVSLTARWSTLSGSALIGGALLGYGCAILADPRFVLPPLAVFLAHLVTTRRHQLTGRLDHRLDAVLCLSIPCLAWVLAVKMTWIGASTGLAGISFAMAVLLALLKAVTCQWLRGRPFLIVSLAKGWFVAGLPGLAWLWRDAAGMTIPLLMALALTPVAALAALRVEKAFPDYPTRLWMIRSVLALAASAPALLYPSSTC
jgi:phytol kinase